MYTIVLVLAKNLQFMVCYRTAGFQYFVSYTIQTLFIPFWLNSQSNRITIRPSNQRFQGYNTMLLCKKNIHTLPLSVYGHIWVSVKFVSSLIPSKSQSAIFVRILNSLKKFGVSRMKTAPANVVRKLGKTNEQTIGQSELNRQDLRFASIDHSWLKALCSH